MNFRLDADPAAGTARPAISTRPGLDDSDSDFAAQMPSSYLEDLERAQTEMARSKQESADLKRQNEELQEQVDSLTREAEAKRSTADGDGWKLKQVEFEKEDREKEVEELKRQLERKNAAASKMQDEMDILRSRVKKVDQAERAQKSFEQQISMAKKKLEEYAEFKVQYGSVVEERETLQLEKDDLQAKLNSSKRDCPGRRGWLSAISVFLCKSVLYGAFVWARRALNRPKRRSPARAVDPRARGRALRRQQVLHFTIKSGY